MSRHRHIRLLLSTSGDEISGHFSVVGNSFIIDKIQGGPQVLFRDRGFSKHSNIRLALPGGSHVTEKNLAEGLSIHVLHRGQVFWKDTIKRIV